MPVREPRSDVRPPRPSQTPRPNGGNVGPLRRTIMLAATALVGAATAVAIGAPAQAAPLPINFNNVTGTTHLKKPNVDVAVGKSTVQTQVDLETNTVTGSANL